VDFLVLVEGRRDKTLTQDRNTLRRLVTLLIRVACSSRDVRASILPSLVLCRLLLPVRFSPRALVGGRPLNWGYVPRASRYTGIIPTLHVFITMAGLASRQHVLDEDRTARTVYYALIYTHSCHEGGD